jgi:hypothetical protein
VSRYLRYAIVEDLDTVRRIPLGRVLGVRVTATPIAWLSPVLFFALRVLMNLATMRGSLQRRVREAALFSLSVQVSNPIHAFGHIVSGTLAGSPMDELLITATRDVNVYEGEQSGVPSHVHLARALGGPLANLFAAGVCRLLMRCLRPSFLAKIIAAIATTNQFYGLGGLLPVPSVDGEVIWRELFRMARLTKPMRTPRAQ